MSSNSIYAQHFLERSRKIHNDFYDYSRVIYKNAREKVEIICPIHGSFFQDPTNHRKGSGCKQCQIDKNITRCTSDTSSFITKATIIHGDTYDYSLVNYIKNNIKVDIICKLHGVFQQKPAKHLCGHGCPSCGKIKSAKSSSVSQTGKTSPKRLSTEQFVNDSIIIHGNIYDYSLVDYKTCKDDVEIICNTHGVFLQKPSKHKSGHGCPHCTQFKSYSSKANKWLDSLNINLIKEYRLPEYKLRSVDGYDPITNTIYQFHGDFYHGNPKVYPPNYLNKKLNRFASELYEETLQKDQQLRDFGYNLVIMWEYDFNNY